MGHNVYVVSLGPGKAASLQLGNGMGMQPTLIPFLVVLGGVLSNRLQNKLIREGEGQSPFAR